MEYENPVREWERTRDLLLEKERHLVQLTVHCARGLATAEQLGALQEEVDHLRMLDGVKFKLAFPLVGD
jgi:hypothetical protein